MSDVFIKSSYLATGFDDAQPLTGQARGLLKKALREFPAGYLLALAAVLIVNLLRSIATQFPQQLSDEAAFLLTSKYFLQWDLIRSLGYEPMPGLALLKFESLLAWSQHTYLLAKLSNAFFVTLAALPAYVVARRVMPSAQARFASVLVAIIPATIYAAYFTAESAYMLAFWVFAAASVSALTAPRQYSIAVMAGVFCAIAYLVKPHAVALGAAYIATSAALWLVANLGRHRLAASTLDEDWKSGHVAAIHLASFAAGAVATLLLLGKAIGGDWLTAFDLRLYSDLAAHQIGAEGPLASIGAVATLLALHVAGVVSSLLLAVAAIAALLARRGSTGRIPVVLAVFSLATVSMLLLMTAKATVDIHAMYGGAETLDRLHGRYYSFSLPLLIFVATGYFNTRVSRRLSMRGAAGMVLIIAAALVCVAITQKQQLFFIDAPDLTYLRYPAGIRALVIAAMLVVLVVALRVIHAKWLILATWGCMSLVNVVAVTRLQIRSDTEGTGDSAVGVLRAIFRPDELDKGFIVSDAHPVAAARAAFRLASRSPMVPTLSDARARMDQSTQWILVLGDQPRAVFGTAQVNAGDSAVYLADQSRVVTNGPMAAPIGSIGVEPARR